MIIFCVCLLNKDADDPHRNRVAGQSLCFLAHQNRRLKGELIVYQSSCRLCVCVSVCVSVNIFKLEYLRNPWVNRNEILSEPSLGWGKGCIMFWARSDQNSGVHGNGYLP